MGVASDSPQVQSIEVAPLTPAFGALVQGLDARRQMEDGAVKQLLDALHRYKVLFLPDQSLTVEEHRQFAAHFGEPFVDPLTRRVDGHPGMATITRVDHFHSDHMHMAEPPKYSLLQMNVLPDLGGDTLWVDLVGSYEALSPAMRTFLETLTALHVSRDPSEDIAARYGAFLGHELDDGELAEIRAALVPHRHPLVRRIPETGGCNYWVCRRFTRRIPELEPAESDAVLAYLFAHQLRPEFVLRWRWKPGDLAFWDHRTTLHAGVDDYGSAERHGQRASVGGGRPVPARGLVEPA